MKHPATFTPAVLDAIEKLAPASGIILDPFAGTGKIHTLKGRLTRRNPDAEVETIGVEIEPAWVSHDRTLQGDATALPFGANVFDAIITSPTYGNRLADSHNAKDGSTRRSYTHDLRELTGDPERTLDAHNTGQFYFWQPEYRRLHEQAWAEATRVAKSRAVFILNTKDFYRNGERQYVTDWHLHVLGRLGWRFDCAEAVPVSGMTYGANRQRVEYESVVRLRLNGGLKR